MTRCRTLVAFTCLYSLFTGGCNTQSAVKSATTSSQQTPGKPAILDTAGLIEMGKQIDANRARALADQAASIIISKDQTELYVLMEKELQQGLTSEQFAKSIEVLFKAYGKPETFEFKMVEYGKKSTYGSWKPIHKFWYAVQTEKHPKGTHFLILEIILSNNDLAVSSAQVVTFPLGKIPPSLQ